DEATRTAVDKGTVDAGLPMSYPVTVPPPHLYDFPWAGNRTVACAWLFGGEHEGGAIAYFGEVLVCENNHGMDLEKRVLAQYVRGGERVLGEMWLKGQQQYWRDFERDENVFQA